MWCTHWEIVRDAVNAILLHCPTGNTRSTGAVAHTDANYKALDALMLHMGESGGISIGGIEDQRALARMGYFHGYKGHRYAGHPARRIPYSDFGEVAAVVAFDSGLKALLYPVLMWIETTMKNLALVAVMDAVGSSDLTVIYQQLMPGDRYGKRAGKLEAIHSNNDVLLASYKRDNPIVRHYYDGPREHVPVWALFEVITFGHFGRFLRQLSDEVLGGIAESWGLAKRRADLVPHLVFALTDLRNGVAHNGVVFDTRFARSGIRSQVKGLVKDEIGIPDGARVDFQTITDHFVLVVFLARRLGFSQHEAQELIDEYVALTDALRRRVPVRVFDMIVRTDNRPKIAALGNWVAGK